MTFETKEAPSDLRVMVRKIWRNITIIAVIYMFVSINYIYFSHQKPAKQQLEFSQQWNKIKIQSCAKKYATMYAIPEKILIGVIQAESGYRIDAVSNAGAIGLCQIMPQTFKQLMGVSINKRGANPFDPEDNINAGARYLSQLKKSHKTWGKALSAYNSGHPDQRYSETRTYVQRVLTYADYL